MGLESQESAKNIFMRPRIATKRAAAALALRCVARASSCRSRTRSRLARQKLTTHAIRATGSGRATPQPRHIGRGNMAIAETAEDERSVDVDAFLQQRANRSNAGDRARNLDEYVRAVESAPPYPLLLGCRLRRGQDTAIAPDCQSHRARSCPRTRAAGDPPQLVRPRPQGSGTNRTLNARSAFLASPPLPGHPRRDRTTRVVLTDAHLIDGAQSSANCHAPSP